MAITCSNSPGSDNPAREGTNQEQRFPAPLDPAYAPVNGQSVERGIVFAQQYASLLNYFDSTNTAAGDWRTFFSRDISALLALVAIEDIEEYKATITSWLDYLNNWGNLTHSELLKENLGYLYSILGTLAAKLDKFKESLPAEIALKGTLQNLIKSQLAPALKRLIGYYNGGKQLYLVKEAIPSPTLFILRSPVVTFESTLNAGFSIDWNIGSDWASINPEESVYGIKPDNSDESEVIFIQINHCATHTLFKSVFDQFLKVLARVISDARRALDDTLTKWDKHEPHYALFLSFLRLLEYARTEANTLTGRHLDFYYREILRFSQKPAVPGQVYLLVELAKHVTSHEFKNGELFKAGKDELGRNTFFANSGDVVINQARVVALKTLYRHVNEPVGEEKLDATNPTGIHYGRIYASPVANSDDGQGAKLISVDQSWHPFFNKVYADGKLQKINMPEAEIGFAIASHYLLMAEGSRTITIDFNLNKAISATWPDHMGGDVSCSLTTEKGWLEKVPSQFSYDGSSKITLKIKLGGADPAITSYSSKIHRYSFETDLPVLLVKLRHLKNAGYLYPLLQDAEINRIDLKVDVKGIKTFAISNEYGQIDVSNPFQPFGPMPEKGSSLIIGSKELFQKKLSALTVNISWAIEPILFSSTPSTVPKFALNVTMLIGGSWKDLHSDTNSDNENRFKINTQEIIKSFSLLSDWSATPDFTANEYYSSSARQGFFKLSVADGFGFKEYQTYSNNALINKITKAIQAAIADQNRTMQQAPLSGTNAEQAIGGIETSGMLVSTGKIEEPVAPTIGALTLNYTAGTTLNSASKETIRFFHLAPFGHAEQFIINGKTTFVLSQFTFQCDSKQQQSEAEFYIGIAGLQPPQNLSLLFQVLDGTANPVVTSNPAINWSYLQDNEWSAFDERGVQDGTDGLLNSGIIIFAIPREATINHSILPSGMIWIRAAVCGNSDAVCKLQLVAAQALKAAFIDQGNSPGFSTTPLVSGTISKLVQPDAAVKTISQPFASFGGRGAEQSRTLNTRISERLRHKDRAISMWDYERLILEAFPQIYKVKCLNHTYYEEEGSCCELAAGHVTILTIPNLEFQHLRDPLKPYTSLGLLARIKAFVEKRISCFTKSRLHVKNPKFEELNVSFNLRLHDGFDETYYMTILQQAITRYLSPWVFADGSSPSFGGKIYKSALINFIEEQPYVDYLADFTLFRDKTPVVSDAVEGSMAASILVSAPASLHLITPIKIISKTQSGKTCQCEA